MYTVENIQDVTKDQGTHLILNTREEFEVHVRYRFGIILVTVNEEELYKRKLTTDYKDSSMKQEEVVEYLKQYLPEELLIFPKTKTEENGE